MNTSAATFKRLAVFAALAFCALLLAGSHRRTSTGTLSESQRIAAGLSGNDGERDDWQRMAHENPLWLIKINSGK